MRFLRRHSLTLVLLVVGLAALAAFTWANWHSFAMRQQQAHVHASFFSTDYLAEWLYNAASNWQSEVLFGAVLVFVLKGAGAHERSADE